MSRYKILPENNMTCPDCGGNMWISQLMEAKKFWRCEDCDKTVRKKSEIAIREDGIFKECLVCGDEYPVPGYNFYYCSKECRESLLESKNTVRRSPE